jgi:hypothetical protein
LRYYYDSRSKKNFDSKSIMKLKCVTCTRTWNWSWPLLITCGAKVFAQMSDSIRPYCQLLNQLNFFLLERAMSEVQTLYQTYLSRTNLRRRKSQKLNTSKKVLATSPSRNIIFSFLLFFLISEEKWKNTFNDDFCSKKSALSNDVLEIKFSLSFCTKI